MPRPKPFVAVRAPTVRVSEELLARIAGLRVADTGHSPDERRALAKLKLAVTLYREGMSADAVEYCDDIIGRHPTSAAAGHARRFRSELMGIRSAPR